MKKFAMTLGLIGLLFGTAVADNDHKCAKLTADATGTTQVQADSTIVSVAQEAGMFNTLLQAATEAGLVETLTSEGPFTVFAPTDEAFSKLPEGTLDSLLADKDQLKAVLLYHVVAGKLMAEDVVGATSLTSVEGSDISVKVKEDKVKVGKATVLKTDMKAGNGVIHAIDTVILPEN